MPKYKNELCVVCKTRKRRYLDGSCEPCHFRISAEGTAEQAGLNKAGDAFERENRKKLWRDIARQYNKLAAKGFTQPQIAQELGMTKQKLRSTVFRGKTEFGIKFVNLTKRRKGTPIPAPTAKTRQYINEHGGGRWGIGKCKCDLCVERRRVSRREIEANRRKIVSEQLARLAELEAAQGK